MTKITNSKQFSPPGADRYCFEFRNSNFGFREEGVTLVLAVVILAAVTFISFSLGAVILREIGAARLILESEPAISGASAGGEIGLFRLLREVGGTSSSGATPQSGASYTIVSDLYDDPYLFSGSAGEQIVVGLYDVENPDNQSTGYQSLTISNDPGSTTIRVQVSSWTDGNPFCTETVPAGSQATCNLNKPDDRYLVVIEDFIDGNYSGELEAPPLGVPADSPGLDITGESGRTQRKIEIDL